MKQTVNDGLRRIRHRKDASILLGFEFHPARFKPRDGVTRLKDFERPQQRRPAAGIIAAQLASIEAGAGDVATSASRNANFRQELGALLKQGDRDSRRSLRASDGRKETGRATSDDHDTPLVHPGPTLPHPTTRVPAKASDGTSPSLCILHLKGSALCTLHPAFGTPRV